MIQKNPLVTTQKLLKEVRESKMGAVEDSSNDKVTGYTFADQLQAVCRVIFMS